jgi:glycosyltransferase involved in cell wall biosynthesis
MGNNSTKAVLMVTFHYPPASGTSGVQRGLKFSRYLPECGWTPLVLTARPTAYDAVSRESEASIPPGTVVARSFALDARRHLAIRGAYPRWLALPDRWGSWWLPAVGRGLGLIRRYRPQVIWSTCPIPTAHLIGLTLARLSRLPWVADFRDPMTEDDYPDHPASRRVRRWIEARAVRNCRRACFTARSTRAMYLSRYPRLSPAASLLIENGFDEADFAGIDADGGAKGRSGAPLRLVHSGVIYLEERDPRPLFRALARLKREGRVRPGDLRIDLRGSGADAHLGDLVRKSGVEDVVRVLPVVPHRESLREQAAADGLLLLQGAPCNRQIPAKTYEYLRLGKPILALTASDGDTASILREIGGATILDLVDESAIADELPGFLLAIRHGKHPLPDQSVVARYSRRGQAQALARCFDELVAESARGMESPDR